MGARQVLRRDEAQAAHEIVLTHGVGDLLSVALRARGPRRRHRGADERGSLCGPRPPRVATVERHALVQELVVSVGDGSVLLRLGLLVVHTVGVAVCILVLGLGVLIFRLSMCQALNGGGSSAPASTAKAAPMPPTVASLA